LLNAGARVGDVDFYRNSALEFAQFRADPAATKEKLVASSATRRYDNKTTKLLTAALLQQAVSQALPVRES